MLRVIPVIDVMNGVVVHAVGGLRDRYHPIVSQHTPSTDPVDVASAIIKYFRPKEMYFADLDAIAGMPPALDTYRAILAFGVRLWVDAGICDSAGAKRVAEAGCDVVAGLETVPSSDALNEIVRVVGRDRVVFSLDLRNGVPLREWTVRGQDQDHVPLTIASMAIATGIRRLIVLDLARVGTCRGPGTEDLCRAIASAYPVELIAGGGISEIEHARRLEACGVKGMLVATALEKWNLNARC
jgi:phosphoribosylformimino-5-aminoimidazole carboxamide ribotide isomerase